MKYPLMVLALSGLAWVLQAGAPEQARRGGSNRTSAEVPTLESNAEAVRTLPTCVTLNGRALLPCHGSAAGVWFYTDPDGGAQMLWTGHAAVPGSWRLTASLQANDEVRFSFPASANVGELTFGTYALSGARLACRTRNDGWTISAVGMPGAIRLTDFKVAGRAATFAPQRRPFSLAPVAGSPDPHPVIAEALVEWDWRLQDGIQTPREARGFGEAISRLVRRTDALVEELANTGALAAADRSAWTRLRADAVPAAESSEGGEEAWLALHRLRRKMVLANPVFRAPRLIFLKHVPSVMSHQLTQAYGYCSRPGGGVFELSEPGASMRARNLTPTQLPAGSFMTLELSFDARRAFFAYAPVKQAPNSWDYSDATRPFRYHLQELNLEDGTSRPLTQGDTDNFSPVCVPGGDLLFLSTRRGGFHRCGRGPCFVYTLARMGPNGEDPRSISFHETHEWDPSLLNDGRVVYTRWDYVDRNAVHYQQLWSARPDGGNVRAYYGNNTWNPTGIWEARAIPGSARVMATAGPHHGLSAGSVILLDTSRAVDGPEAITRLTPDVRFPESESPLAMGPAPTGYDFDTPVQNYWRSPLQESGMQAEPTEEEKRWPGHCYKCPWPFSEKFFLVSYSFDPLVGEPGPNLPNMFGLYFADAFGNKELIYRDPAISSLWARPLAPRAAPPQLPLSSAQPERETGTFFVSDVQESWPRLPATNRVSALRIVQVLLKTTPNADSPRVGAAFAAPGKQVLGTVPVERDGSAYFTVPARTPLLFQALDAQGRAIQTMRSLVYLQPGEQESCVGCHEHRLKREPARSTALASQRPPSALQPGPDGSRPFSYPRLVQPVLDRHCVSCHGGPAPKPPILTGEPEGDFTKSYNALVNRVSYSAWNRPQQNFEPLTEPLRFGALGSQLGQLLESGHGQVVLEPDEKERLYLWMDCNALFYGTFDVTEQRKQLAGQVIAGPRE